MFKFLGVIGVVLIHADALFPASKVVFYDVLNLAARVVVPVFFMISGYFIEKRRAAGHSALGLWRDTVRRLLLPFVVWSLVYLLIPADWPGFIVSRNPAHAYMDWLGEVRAVHFQRRIPLALLLGGGKGHLWFLFALMFSVTASTALRRLLTPAAVMAIAAALYMIGLILAPYRDTAIGIKLDWGTHDGGLSLRYIGSLIGFLYFEIGATLYRQREAIGSRVATLLLLSGLVLTMTEGAWLHVSHGLEIRDKFYLLGTIPYALGLFMLIIMAQGFRAVPLLSFCGRYSLGIYALHFLLLDGVMRNVPGQLSFLDALLIVFGVFGVTTAIVIVMGRVRFLRPLVS